MHLQQSHVNKHGGPQYWLQKAPDHILGHIQRHKKCQVILQTPCDPVETPFNAVDPERKHSEIGNVVARRIARAQIPKGKQRESTNQRGIEKITCAAVMLTNGHVYTGLFHGDAVEKARHVYAEISESYFSRLFGKSKDGYMTNKGRFVSRDEAYKIAVKGCQMTPKSYVEAVQDLWGDNVNADGELCALAFQNVRADKSPALKAFENAQTDNERQLT